MTENIEKGFQGVKNKNKNIESQISEGSCIRKTKTTQSLN